MFHALKMGVNFDRFGRSTPCFSKVEKPMDSHTYFPVLAEKAIVARDYVVVNLTLLRVETVIRVCLFLLDTGRYNFGEGISYGKEKAL